ncbi:hypothetical protein [Cupriavidus yeoncheonensis]|uniref:hypothetical protein n=1 Tax=Cupriavidus yeoncheonensis TaxID=1462994 RepID=UPI001BA5201E|nr:hypothetical protein [Cupriavidus yeoncheonensis]
MRLILRAVLAMNPLLSPIALIAKFQLAGLDFLLAQTTPRKCHVKNVPLLPGG